MEALRTAVGSFPRKKSNSVVIGGIKLPYRSGGGGGGGVESENCTHVVLLYMDTSHQKLEGALTSSLQPYRLFFKAPPLFQMFSMGSFSNEHVK